MASWKSGGARSALLGDLRRHFPHQAEQLEGIARGAGVGLRALAAEWLRCLREPMFAVAAICEGSAQLYAALPADAVLRHSLSEGRFETDEYCRPSLTAPLLGVNEAGLAVAVLGCFAPEGRTAPGALLARDCLERFEEVEAALAWCRVRPGAAGHALLFADARGGLCAVDRRGAVAERVAPEAGLICLGVSPEVSAALREALADGEAALHAELAALWGGDLAGADPVARCTRLVVPERSL
ncbi:MAG: hypothetical protein HRU02_06645 [Myxococcales bacterium]|nr:hypothetical protein [Myxococcales bacterium]